MTSFTALIQQPTPSASGPGAPGQPAGNPIDPIWNTFVFLGVPFLFLYLIFLRPAQKQEKQRKEQLNQLKKNDEVLFAGGIIGRVVEIKEKPGGVAGQEDVVIVRTDDKNRFSILRSAIARVGSGAEGEKKELESK